MSDKVFQRQIAELRGVARAQTKVIEKEVARAEAAEADAARLRKALEHLIDDAYHHEDGDDRSMTLDVSIARARAALSDTAQLTVTVPGKPTETYEFPSDTAQPMTLCDSGNGSVLFMKIAEDAAEKMRERAAKLADPPLMHRKGKPGLWRRRRAAIAAQIRSLPLEPE